MDRLPLPSSRKLRRQVSNALRLLQDPQSPVDHLLACRCYPRQVAPLAHEYLEPELVLEQL